MAEDDKNSNAKLSEVSSKLSILNNSQNTGLGNLKSLTETLVSQGKSAADSADSVARVTRENQREAARARKTVGALDVNVLNWQKQDGGILGTLANMLAMVFPVRLFGLSAAVVGAISGALIGAAAGLTVGFLGMWKNIFKFIGGKLAKMFPNVTKMLSGIFGKGGKVSKFFTSIKAFFLESKAFKTISNMIDTAKGAIAKAMKPVKTAFTTMKTQFTSFITKIKSWIKLITGPIDSIKKILGVGAKTGGGGMGFLKGFKTFFKIFKTFFAKLFVPLQVIISLVEGFFEAKDAADKSEGMAATFFNSIIGFFGGILDGLIFGMLDLIKDGISWIAGFLGFEDVEKFLDSFSFSDMFNEFLDDVYKWFNLLFSDPVKALTDLFAGYFGAALSVGDFIVDMLKKPLVHIMNLFGWDDAAAATEKFSLSGWVMGKWEDVKAWFTGIFSWTKSAGATEEGGWSIMKFIDTVWTKVKTWFTDLLTWGKKAGADGEGGWSLNSFIFGKEGLIEKIRGYISGLFTWGKKAGETEEGGWSLTKFIYGTDGVLSKIKTWLNSIFSFEGKNGEKVGLVDKIVELFNTIPDKIVQLFKDMIARVQGFFTNITMPWQDSPEEKKAKVIKKKEGQERELKLAKVRKTKYEEKVKENPNAEGWGSPQALLASTKENILFLENQLKNSNAELAAIQKTELHHGGPILQSGSAIVHKGELMMDNNAAMMMFRSAEILSRLQLQNFDVKRESRNTGSQPMVINNNNQSNVRTSNAPMLALSSPINPDTKNQLPGTA